MPVPYLPLEEQTLACALLAAGGWCWLASAAERAGLHNPPKHVYFLQAPMGSSGGSCPGSAWLLACRALGCLCTLCKSGVLVHTLQMRDACVHAAD